MSGILSGIETLPDHLVTVRYVSLGLNVGWTPCLALGFDAGRSKIGTESAYAVATPAKAFSAPGPACIANTPVLSPLVIRLYPSARLTPTRSCLNMSGLIPACAPASSNLLNGITPMKSTPSALSIWATKSAPITLSSFVV